MDADDFLHGSVASTPSLSSKIITLPTFDKQIQMTGGIVFCGYNLDTPGITLAGGRSGTQLGPDCLKAVNLPLESEYFSLKSTPLVDHGNVSTSKTDPLTQQQAQLSLSKLLTHCLKLNLKCVVLGGSNNSFPSIASAFLNSGSTKQKTIIKLDSSLDCNPSNGNKSTYQFLRRSSQDLKQLVFFGAQGRLIQKKELTILKESWCKDKFKIVMLDKEIRKVEKLKPYRTQAGACFAQILQKVEEGFLSIDLQVLNSAFFPGVGNPSVVGLSIDQLCQILQIVGSSSKINIVDIAEFNPCTDKSKSGAQLVKLVMHLIGEWARIEEK